MTSTLRAESVKPRSMPVGQRNILRSNDSASLWNCSLSPGWTRQECEILRKAVLKYGTGNWKDVIESGCLPGKTNAQLNLQLQRLLGQQSTAEFQGIHLDPATVGAMNALRTGVKRKNGCIVNTGGRPSREELQRRIQENRAKFEVAEDVWKTIEIPKMVNEAIAMNPTLVLEEKKAELVIYQKQLEQIRSQIRSRRQELLSAFQNQNTTRTSATVQESKDLIGTVQQTTETKLNDTTVTPTYNPGKILSVMEKEMLGAPPPTKKVRSTGVSS